MLDPLVYNSVVFYVHTVNTFCPVARIGEGFVPYSFTQDLEALLVDSFFSFGISITSREQIWSVSIEVNPLGNVLVTFAIQLL